MSQDTPGTLCSHCGTLNRSAAKICKQCGKSLTDRAAPPPTVPEPVTSRDQSTALRKGETRRLPSPGFSDLPHGAVVNKRFEVIRTFETQPHANSYLVEDTLAPHNQWMLLESDNLHDYQHEQMLLDHAVHHPALVEIGDVFRIKYGDDTRVYLLQEFPLHEVAPGNHREIETLQWGTQLADALTHLHDKKIAHGNIQPANLYLSNNQIKLGGYTNLTAFAPDAGPQDVSQLAQTLYQLAIPLGENAPTFSPAALAVVQRALERHYNDARTFQTGLQQALDAMRHPTRITTTVGRLSDVGRRRAIDEDSLLTTEITQFAQAGSQVIGLYAVADGMGGASAGEVASKLVTEAIARQVMQRILAPHLTTPDTALDYAAILQAAIEQANVDVLAARTQAHTDMGSTVVAALLVGTHTYIANVGDSRAYLIAPDQITQITTDHSFVQALVERGAISQADVRTHPQRNLILRNVGDKPHLQIDLFDVKIEAGQSLLLCCDGLWEMVLDEQIREIVTRHANPQDACRELIQVANDNGGDDNITCVLVRVESA
jgi:serine/threonine protein phosphatase PrpC